MKTLYIDCGMGAAGDMLMAALLELLPDKDGFVEELNALGIPGVKYVKEASVKCGITGTHMRVTVDGAEEESHDHHDDDHEHHHHDHDDHDHHHHDHDDYDHYHHHDHDDHDHHHHDHDDHDHHHHHDHDDHDHHHHDHDDHDHHHHDHDDYDHYHHHDHDDHDHHHHDHDDHDHHHHHDHDDHDHHHHHHHHASMGDVEHIVRDHLHLPASVQDDVMAVYGLIAEAESHAHGVPVTEIHFHEVGTMDAIADVVAVCLLMKKLAPEKIVVSPIHVGSGQVRCAHGILPVPAPATAFILKDAPIYGGTIRGELCTPTGAALLKHFATEFGNMPAMNVNAIGYGMGKKDFEVANCVRVMLGENWTSARPGEEKTCESSRNESKEEVREQSRNEGDEKVYELSCNVDDMTGEEVGFAMERLFEAGARDVYTIPIGMKKNRPGILIRALCVQAQKEKLVEAMFKHTTTIGIRECELSRYVLNREIDHVDTPCGTIHRKTSSGYGVKREKLEFEDLARIAREQGISLWEARYVNTRTDQ